MATTYPEADHQREQRRPGCERRRARRLLLRDRRTGFDRRHAAHRAQPGAAFAASLEYLRDHGRALAQLLVLANLLSLTDLTVTLYLMRHGVPEENPVMRYLFALGPLPAALVKTGVVALVSLALWQLRSRRPALEAALLLVSAFAIVVLYELVDLALTM